MKVYISGASGLVGSALAVNLGAAGHTVHRLVRDRALATAGDVYWNPASGELDAKAIADCDAVVNLSGENIAARRWNAKQKQKILDSRTRSTRTIAQALSPADGRPKTLINASAIGIYGDRGDQWLDESSSPGNDFLADVCRQWEAATQPAQAAGARRLYALRRDFQRSRRRAPENAAAVSPGCGRQTGQRPSVHELGNAR